LSTHRSTWKHREWDVASVTPIGNPTTIPKGHMMDAKPKMLLYADALTAIERRIVEALPEIIDGLIARAREGDTRAAAYLCDRILGRVAGSEVAPANDCRAPYTEDAFLLDQQEEDEKSEMRRLLAGFGARNGV
jgi:hypothetical protein